jgi:serine/threonine-protein kinase
MFTLASGRLVHNAETVNELMLAAMTKAAPPVASVVPNLPPPVAEVIDRALAYDFNVRWPDARSMQTALRAAYRSFDRVSLVTGASGAFQAYSGPQAPQTQAPGHVDPQPSGYRPQPPGYVDPNPPGFRPQAPGRATGQPVVVGGGGTGVATGPARGRFPVLPLVGGLLGALVMGAIVLFAVTRRHAATPDVTATASASADPAPEPAASVTTTASVSATASASASAPTSKPAQTPPPLKPRGSSAPPKQH